MSAQKKEQVTEGHLVWLHALADAADEAVWDAVVDARSQQDPLTWDQIGAALGMTRQSAWEKHTLYRRRSGTDGEAGLQKERLPLGPVERNPDSSGSSARGRVRRTRR